MSRRQVLLLPFLLIYFLAFPMVAFIMLIVSKLMVNTKWKECIKYYYEDVFSIWKGDY